MVGENGKKKSKQAAALSFEPGKDFAPVISGLGRDYLAEKMIETAKENGVPVVCRPEVAGALGSLRMGKEIPPELYEVVAQIMIFIRYMDQGFDFDEFGRDYDERYIL